VQYFDTGIFTIIQCTLLVHYILLIVR